MKNLNDEQELFNVANRSLTIRKCDNGFIANYETNFNPGTFRGESTRVFNDAPALLAFVENYLSDEPAREKK